MNMKRWLKKYLLGVGAVLATVGICHAADRTYGGYLVNDPTLSYNQTYDLQTDQIDNLGEQVILSSANVSPFSFNDGVAASAQLTVLSTTSLKAHTASNTVTITTNALPSSAAISINGVAYRNGTEWYVGTNSTNTAINIANYFNGLAGYAASTTAFNVATIVTRSSGTSNNNITFSVNTTSMTVGGATFTGGADNVFIDVNNVPLIQGTDWTAASTASGTAKAISDAIVANSSLSGVIVSTWSSGGVVFATAAISGTAGNSFTLFSSNLSSISTSVFSGGTANAISSPADTITLPAHGISTGFPMWFQTVTGNAPTGLTSGTTYYGIKVDANTIQLASTSTGSIAGAAINITTASVNGGDSYKLNPTAFAGTWYGGWLASNDGSNFFSLANNPTACTGFSLYTSSFSYSTPGSCGWDGTIPYRYLRFNFIAGTGGGMNIKIVGNGKKWQ